MFAYTCAKGCEHYFVDSNTLVNLCTGLFILPYFLFSATAGELADHYPKQRLILIVKLAEIVIVCLVGIGLYLDNAFFLISILFLLGTHSTFFGPIKYSALPELLPDHELIAANGLIEMATFVAIIFGTIAGGLFIGIDVYGESIITILLITFAVCGYVAARYIPKLPANDAPFKIRLNPIPETIATLKLAASNRLVFSCIICISWFWMYGATFLTQLPNFNVQYLNGSEEVITLLLTTVALGIGLGSVLCERLCQGRVEMGLVPLGAIGLTFFACDLGLIGSIKPEAEVGISEFLQIPHSWHLLTDLFLLGISSGIYTVPLYTLVQYKSPRQERSRMIAANNIMNSIFMVFASLSAIVYFQLGCTIKQVFLITGVLTGLFSLYLFQWIPEFLMRFVAWFVVHMLYRVDKCNLSFIPKEGPGIIAANHTSILDAIILLAISPRPIRFVITNQTFTCNPILRFVLKTAKAIPLDLSSNAIQSREEAYLQITRALEQGELIGIFPEGERTYNGEIQPFKPMIDHLLEKTPVSVIPVALQGLWGSFFSKKHGHTLLHLPRRFLWSKIGAVTGKPIAPNEFNTQKLETTIKVLRGSWA